jgi:hypothetical protein
MKHNDNTVKKAMKIQALVRQHYKEGRQDRCKLWVYRHIIVKEYPMGIRTFYRYMSIKAEEKENQ